MSKVIFIACLLVLSCSKKETDDSNCDRVIKNKNEFKLNHDGKLTCDEKCNWDDDLYCEYVNNENYYQRLRCSKVGCYWVRF